MLIVSDEIHSDLVFHGKKHIPTATLSPEIAANVISCISGTKTFNMAGLQASAVIFPNMELKAKYDRFWMNLDIHRNNAVSSVAMETAFNEGEEGWSSFWYIFPTTLILSRITVRNTFLRFIPMFRTLPIWYGWIAGSWGMSNEELSRFMVEKAGLGLSDGYTFGRSLSGYMRLNAACPRSVLKQALEQLRAAVEAL